MRSISVLFVAALFISATTSAHAIEPPQVAHPAEGKCGLLMESIFSLASTMGKENEKKEEASALWIRAQANEGSAVNQATFGIMYFMGTGVGKDEAEGTQWLRKSAEQGYMPAQYLLSILYQKCTYLRNDAEAVKWTKRAAEQGDENAQENLARFYHNGTEGLPRDNVEADKWFILAAKKLPFTTFFMERTLTEIGLSPQDQAKARREALLWKPKIEFHPSVVGRDFH